MPIIISGNQVISTTGVLPVELGGTGSSNGSGAVNNLLPVQEGNSGKVLTTDGTILKWASLSQSSGTGTVTSINVSGGTTGVVFVGGPITNSGVITMGGILGISNGGTGATNQQEAINKLVPSQDGNMGKVLTTDGVNVSWQFVTSGSGSGGIQLSDLSVTNTPPGTAQLTYNSSSGVFTYTPPDLSVYQLASNAFSGSYDDLTNKPLIPASVFDLDVPSTVVNPGFLFYDGNSIGWNQINYTDLINKPTIPSRLTDLSIVDGSDGQVLTTDGSGNFAFTTISTSGGSSYVLPIAGVAPSGTLGGIIVGDNLTIDANGVLSAPAPSEVLTYTFTIEPLGPIEGAAISVSESSGPVTLLNIKSGSGITVTKTNDLDMTVSNTGVTKIVAGTGISITSSGPDGTGEVTINSTVSGGSGSGTVTSVNVDGGTTGLTFTGGPITESGVITIGGTLSVANGGTGQSTFANGYVKASNNTLSSSSTIPGSDVIGDISGNASGIAGILSIEQGGTGNGAYIDGYVVYNQSFGGFDTVSTISGESISGDIPGNAANVTGIISTLNGGTGIEATDAFDLINKILPDQTDNSGKVLTTDGSTVYWEQSSGGGGGASMSLQLVTDTTVVLNPDETVDISLDFGQAYILYKVETSAPAWIKVYVSEEARTNDSNRPIEQEPLNISGIVAEAITVNDNLNKVIFAPGVNGFNDADPPSSMIPISITNKSDQAQAIVIVFTIIKLVA